MMTFQPPTCLLLLTLLLQMVHAHTQLAEDCRVYHLETGTDNHKAPPVLLRDKLEVSIWVEDPGDLPRNVLMNLGAKEGSVSVYINRESEVVVRVNEQPVGGVLTLDTTSPHAHTWFTLVLDLYDNTMQIFRPEDRLHMLTVEDLPLEDHAQVEVSGALHLVFNCMTGCMIHDKVSPLFGEDLGVGSSLTLYVRPKEGDGQPVVEVAPVNSTTHAPGHVEVVDMTTWERERWHKLVLQAAGEQDDSASGEVVELPGENISYTIVNVTEALWTLRCYPDTAIDTTNTTEQAHPHDHDGSSEDEEEDEEDEEEEGAGAGEVLAWVLAGLALFLVMILALALCTKMGPPAGNQTDFFPSVGVVSQRYASPSGHHREAEEESEPGSPMLTVPPVHRKLPQEDQYSTKML